MEQIMDYIKPELLVVSVVLYFAGIGLKKSRVVPDKFIPLILGAAGIVICAVWVIASCPLDTGADIAMGNIHSHCAGSAGGRTEHICKPDRQADM